MARQLRIEYPGAFYHLINRGYRQETIFLDDDDFEKFLYLIKELYRSHAFVIHSYCLMNNHFHLFTEIPLGNLSEIMHLLESRYASYFKKKYKHKNKVFERRFISILVDSDSYALELSRYISRNPLDVIVEDLELWTWSSYRALIGLIEPEEFLDIDLILNRLDPNQTIAKKKYKEFTFMEDSVNWVPENFIVGNSILGSKEFIERIKEKYIPEEIDSEFTGLVCLKAEDKVKEINKYISLTTIDEPTRNNLLIYALRKKTYLKTNDINKLTGLKLKTNSMTTRVKRFEKKAKENRKLNDILIDFNSKF